MTDEQAVRKATAEQMLVLLRGWSDSEFAVAASGEFCEDLKGCLEGALSREMDRAEQAEAALAEERKAHQAFREEVSEACHNACYYAGNGEFLNIPEVKRILERFILPAKPADPLVEIVVDLWDFDHRAAAELRAAIERAGGTISFEGGRG